MTKKTLTTGAGAGSKGDKQLLLPNFTRGHLADLALPAKRNKHRALGSLPEVIKAKEELARGIGPAEYVRVRLDPALMTQMRVVTGGRIVKDILRSFIEKSKIKAKDNAKLSITRFKDESGAENVMVAYPTDELTWGYENRGKGKKKKRE